MFLRRDEGYTLSELIAVIGLLGIIMGVAYAGMHIAMTGTAFSDEQAIVSEEIAAPLDLVDQVFTQSLGFDVSYPGVQQNRVAVFTDQNADGVQERWQFEVDGTRLVVTHGTAGGGSADQAVWSESNANIAESEPLFRFYGPDGEITDMGDVANDTTYVIVTLMVRYRDATLSDSRTVFMRN
ncbi:MAG TPA: hypothetical protein DCP20_04050 [Coriobacteriia bacterium]|nr:MAG: hypothetical protein XD74_1915 [Actinobacteria bacterium 66_15]HAL29875.1 hypothetical protein [Coriobacteriia bacterium]